MNHEDKFTTLITAIIAAMVVLLTLRSCYE